MTMPMKNIVIVGGGGFGREMVCWSEDVCKHDATMKVRGVIDDDVECFNAYPHYKPFFLGTIKDFHPQATDVLVMAIGGPHVKMKIAAELEARGAKFLTLVHPSAIIGRNCTLGEGTVVCPGAIITSDVTVGRFVTINVHSTIGHDVVVGDGATLSAHCDLTGFVRVGTCAFFGTHAVVLPSGKIGDNARVGAGSVVLKSAQPDSTVMGVPAKHIL